MRRVILAGVEQSSRDDLHVNSALKHVRYVPSWKMETSAGSLNDKRG